MAAKGRLRNANCSKASELVGNKRTRLSRKLQPDLVNAILQALTDSVTEDEILEAEDLIRELEHPEDKAKCEQALAHKRRVKVIAGRS